MHTLRRPAGPAVEPAASDSRIPSNQGRNRKPGTRGGIADRGLGQDNHQKKPQKRRKPPAFPFGEGLGMTETKSVLVRRRTFIKGASAVGLALAAPAFITRRGNAADTPTVVNSIRSLSNPYHATWK